VAVAVIIVAAIGVLVAINRSNDGNPTTETGNCCADANLNLSTSCSTVTPNSPAVLRLEQRIEADPTFIAAEDGHNYTANYGVGCGFAINPGSYNGTTVDPVFTYTSDRLYTDNCGYTGNFTYYLTVRVPLTETGYDLSAMQIVPNSSSEITVTCTTNT
jgi:hypothetical protein